MTRRTFIPVGTVLSRHNFVLREFQGYGKGVCVPVTRNKHTECGTCAVHLR